jgi:hypothetical protein
VVVKIYKLWKIFSENRNLMAKIKFKYRIDELLNQLPVVQYRAAMQIIPQQLAVSAKTFANYRHIKLHEKRDIPHEKVALLEKLFALQPGGLQNFVTECTSLAELTQQLLKTE